MALSEKKNGNVQMSASIKMVQDILNIVKAWSVAMGSGIFTELHFMLFGLCSVSIDFD